MTRDHSGFEIYPNPVATSAHILYKIQKPQHLKIRIFTLLGQEVVTLVDSFQSAGIYKIQFSPGDIPAGVYIADIETNGNHKSQPFVILR